jgi:hypothetical protein
MGHRASVPPQSVFARKRCAIRRHHRRPNSRSLLWLACNVHDIALLVTTINSNAHGHRRRRQSEPGKKARLAEASARHSPHLVHLSLGRSRLGLQRPSLAAGLFAVYVRGRDRGRDMSDVDPGSLASDDARSRHATAASGGCSR